VQHAVQFPQDLVLAFRQSGAAIIFIYPPRYDRGFYAVDFNKYDSFDAFSSMSYIVC